MCSNNGLAPHLGGKKLDLEMIYEEEDDMIDDSSGHSDQGGLLDISILEIFIPAIIQKFNF